MLGLEALMGMVPPCQAMGASTCTGGKSTPCPLGSPYGCVVPNSSTDLKKLPWDQLCALESHTLPWRLPAANLGFPLLWPLSLLFLPPTHSVLCPFLHLSLHLPPAPNSPLAWPLLPATPWLLHAAGLSGESAVWAAVLWAQVALADASSFHSCE